MTEPSEAGRRGSVRLHAVAAAALLSAFLLQPGNALALALGRIAVQSSLGEPLRAEIDVLEISAEEASNLRVSLAPAETFRTSGMELNPALAGLQVSFQRRADGRPYLSLVGVRPVNEPFIDMVLEANWPAGKITRDYTLLIDPPKLPSPPPSPISAAVTPQTAPSPVAPLAVPARPAAATAAPAAPTAVANGGESRKIKVNAGDTAGKIASTHRPANASLDQMLVAMLRANPKAFIGGNVNRVKAGTILDLPDEAGTNEISAAEARRIVAAQSRDFNEFRRRLAAAAPEASVATADRQASGKVQTEVEDKKPAPATQDKLTLSKGTSGQSGKEDAIAQQRQSKESSTRVAELSRNIDELSKIGPAVPASKPPATPAPKPATTAPAATNASPPNAPAAAATTPAPAASAATPSAAAGPATPPAAAPVTPPATPAAPPAPEPAVATAQPAEPSPAPAPSPAPQPAPPPPKPPAPPAPAVAPQESSFIDQLLENPLLLPGVGALLALLGGFAFYRFRQKKKAGSVDSSFLESRLQPDSFFGSSGGQRIDTAEATASGSSMVYSPSQLDAAGDVDPVAEADVYLAYGRDLQAEEILKEAMRSAPTRVAIHNKLLEIYAKRRDARAFEVVAAEAYGLTQGQGPEWEHACELGKELDPNNPLYQPGGAPAVRPGATPSSVPGVANTVPFGASTLGDAHTEEDAGGLDLDLDFMEESSRAPLSATPSRTEARVSAMDDLSSTDAITSEPAALTGPGSRPMDFDLDFPSDPLPLTTPSGSLVPTKGTASTPTFDSNEVLPDFDMAPPAQPVAASAPELMSFDLGDLSLDLTGKSTAGGSAESSEAESPLETKLSLAEEFRAIGDLEGARSLAEEVMAEATGTLKTKASAFLADLA